VFGSAAFSSQAYLAWLTANRPALANDGHASLGCADLVICAAAAVTLASGGAASPLCADPPFAAAGVATLVLRRTAHLVNTAGLVIATERATG
jgi:hypothetical protein